MRANIIALLAATTAAGPMVAQTPALVMMPAGWYVIQARGFPRQGGR